VVRDYLAQHPGASALDVAGALDITEADALGAMSDTAWEIPAGKIAEVMAEISAWDSVLVLVRNSDGVAEVKVPGRGGYANGDWFNWIGETYNLHIRVSATRRVLALVRPGKRGLTYSLNLVNHAGQVFCRFYTRTPMDTERFLTFCQAYAVE
jgi:putative heme degradation protein